MSRFLFPEEPIILALQAHQVFYIDDSKNGANLKVVQVIQIKCILDVSKVKDVEDQQLNILKIVVRHHVDDNIEDNTMCRRNVDPTIAIMERLIVRHVVDDFINDDDEQLSIQSRSAMTNNNNG